MCDACNEQCAVETWGEQAWAPVCAICDQRIAGAPIAPDPEHRRSWTILFCSERCKALQALCRL